MHTDLLRSKFLGALVGTAIGDALGAGFEGCEAADEGAILALAEERHVLRYTDDTHMMIGVAESLVAIRGFDGEHMSRRFIENYRHEPWRGYGPGPPRVFRMIGEGERWDRASGRLYGGGSFGNGAAMRIAPVGILYYDEPAELREVALQSSLITHAHELGREGGLLQATAVALAARADPASSLDCAEYLAELAKATRQAAFRAKLERISGLLGQPGRSGVVDELGHGIEALDSVPTAIYSFLSFPASFEKAVVCAVSLGGDTDTIAAMTGAVSGAFLGVDAIPGAWRAKLENGSHIESLARELWQIKIGASSH